MEQLNIILNQIKINKNFTKSAVSKLEDVIKVVKTLQPNYKGIAEKVRHDSCITLSAELEEIKEFLKCGNLERELQISKKLNEYIEYRTTASNDINKPCP